MGERRNQEGENYRSGPIGNPENGMIAYHQTEMRNPPHSTRRFLASECRKAIILSRISLYFAAGDTNVGIGPSSPCYLTFRPGRCPSHAQWKKRPTATNSARKNIVAGTAGG